MRRLRYTDLFEQNGVDGWVFSEIDDREEYVEIGIKHEHAVVLIALTQAIKGHWGEPMAIDHTRTAAVREAEAQRAAVDKAALEAADHAAETQGDGKCYGQLVVLGYKEYRVEGSTWHPVGSRNDKFALNRRKVANGIQKHQVYLSTPTPSGGAGGGNGLNHGRPLRSQFASHSVTMSVRSSAPNGQGGTRSVMQQVTIEYVPDETTDMFQLGRMVVPQNDFVVRGPLHMDANGVLCGPVSRYACRIVCSRLAPFDCYIFAAGFNNERDIFLSEQAPKWRLGANGMANGVANGMNNGMNNAVAGGADGEATSAATGAAGSASGTVSREKEKDGSARDGSGSGGSASGEAEGWDALTTFGVRIWKPEVGSWREVSVNGSIHEPRTQPSRAGGRLAAEVCDRQCRAFVRLLSRSRRVARGARRVARGDRAMRDTRRVRWNARDPLGRNLSEAEQSTPFCEPILRTLLRTLLARDRLVRPTLRPHLAPHLAPHGWPWLPPMAPSRTRA